MRIVSTVWEMRHPVAFFNTQVKIPIKLFARRIFESYREKTTNKVNSFRELLFKAGVVALTTSVVVWLSVFLYVAFYYSYMPNITHSRPVHLQFKSCNENRGICSYPSAHVQLTKKQQLLMVGQPYRIKLALDMPESEANKQLGMFMCCAEARARGGVLVSAACRSGLLPYRSPLLTLITTLAHAPLYVAGLRQERQTVELELFTHYEDDSSQPVTDVYVEIQSRHIELYSAVLYIHAHFSGLRYIMFHWPMLSAVVGICSNLLFVALVCALSWYHLQSGFEDEGEDSAEKKCEPLETYLFDDDISYNLSLKEEVKDEESNSSNDFLEDSTPSEEVNPEQESTA